MTDLGEAARAVAGGASVKEAMAILCRAMVERASGGSRASVMRYVPMTNTLALVASDGLPASYLEAMELFGGVPVAPAYGSCGTAAYRRTTIVVDDIESSPLWIGTAHLPLSVGLRSCWSVPVLSRGGDLLGTVAMFRDHTRPVDPADLALGRDAARRAAEILEAQAGRRAEPAALPHERRA